MSQTKVQLVGNVVSDAVFAGIVTATSLSIGGQTTSSLGIGINTAGGSVGTGATVLDFRGAGISTVTVASGIATVNITGGGGGGASVTTSDTAPSTPADGDLWYDSTGGRLYVYYDDGNTSQWVDAAPQGGGNAFTAKIEVGNTKAEITDTGSDGTFAVTTEGTQRLTVDSSGRLLVGVSTARDKFYNTTISPQLQLEGFGDAAATISVVQSAANSTTSALLLGKQRSGTIGGNTVVQSEDALGAISFQGSDGTELVESASILARVDGSPGSNSMPGRLIFSTTASGSATSTEQLRITSDRYIRLASGTGGIQFGGDTAAANALDDYEEGTWTPTLTFGGGSTGITYSGRRGYYTKIGNIVVYNVQIALSNKGSSTGSAYITGMPFALVTTGNANASSGIRLDNASSISGGVITVYTFQGLNLFQNSSTALTDSNFTNSTSMEFSICGTIV